MNIMRNKATHSRAAAKDASHERIVSVAARAIRRQGYHGTGKSTHIEQVAARLNWPLTPAVNVWPPLVDSCTEPPPTPTMRWPSSDMCADAQLTLVPRCAQVCPASAET